MSEVARLDGTQVAIIGATSRGTMLLVERPGPGFDTDYVWVRPDGRRAVLPDTRTYGVQDAAVSYDRHRAPGLPRAVRDLQIAGPPPATYWTSDDDVLIALPSAVVRCDAEAVRCERVLDTTAAMPAGSG